MMASEKIEGSIKELEQKRKAGELGAVEFYKGLIDTVGMLREELLKEDIDEGLAKRQIPLLLTFIKNQIRELRSRSN